jgi:hypothetical protein
MLGPAGNIPPGPVITGGRLNKSIKQRKSRKSRKQRKSRKATRSYRKRMVMHKGGGISQELKDEVLSKREVELHFFKAYRSLQEKQNDIALVNNLTEELAKQYLDDDITWKDLHEYVIIPTEKDNGSAKYVNSEGREF